MKKVGFSIPSPRVGTIKQAASRSCPLVLRDLPSYIWYSMFILRNRLRLYIYDFSMSTSEPSADHRSQRQGLSVDTKHRWESVNAILHKPIQPESTLSLEEAVNLAVEFYNDDKRATITNIAMIELADKLPYVPLGHLKLA